MKHGKDEEEWRERKRRYNRTYYLKNRKRIIADQVARNRYKLDLPSDMPEEEAIRRRRAYRRHMQSLERAHAAQRRIREEWLDLGHIVAKMNLEAGMSQEQIYQVLQGLTTKKKIAEWCRRGRQRAKVRAQRKKPPSADHG
jgi:hypothetical protein